MRVPSLLLLTLLGAAIDVSARDEAGQFRAKELSKRDLSHSSSERYPICPELYDTYCCMTVAPHSVSCRGGQCTRGPGWSCVIGPGKVDSMKYCMTEVGGNKSPYCKRPGYEHFGSILRWTGGSFEPMLKPSDYKSYLRPGMHKPWIPPRGAIRWEEQEANEDESDDSSSSVDLEELRKREAEYGDVDMA